MTDRALDGRGKGTCTYDYANDVLLFNIKDRAYRESVELGNIVIDIDDQDFITGIQLMDAAKLLRIPKYALRTIRQFEFQARREGSTITIQLNFTCTLRNKTLVSKGQDILREAPFSVASPRTVTATT